MADASLTQRPPSQAALAAEAEAFVSRAVMKIRRARALVVQERRHSAGLLTARRYELIRLLGEYQRFKHRHVFDPVIATGSADERARARALKCDCILMGEFFGAYHARWSHLEDVEWPTYRRDMLATVDTLIDHLEAELAAIWALSAPPTG